MRLAIIALVPFLTAASCDTAQTALQLGVAKYCAKDPAIREIIRGKLAELLAPNSLEIHCQRDAQR